MADRMKFVDVLPAGPTSTSTEAKEGPRMPDVMVCAVKDFEGAQCDTYTDCFPTVSQFCAAASFVRRVASAVLV
jgi:hypothetical protein